MNGYPSWSAPSPAPRRQRFLAAACRVRPGLRHRRATPIAAADDSSSDKQHQVEQRLQGGQGRPATSPARRRAKAAAQLTRPGPLHHGPRSAGSRSPGASWPPPGARRADAGPAPGGRGRPGQARVALGRPRAASGSQQRLHRASSPRATTPTATRTLMGLSVMLNSQDPAEVTSADEHRRLADGPSRPRCSTSSSCARRAMVTRRPRSRRPRPLVAAQRRAAAENLVRSRRSRRTAAEARGRGHRPSCRPVVPPRSRRPAPAAPTCASCATPRAGAADPPADHRAGRAAARRLQRRHRRASWSAPCPARSPRRSAGAATRSTATGACTTAPTSTPRAAPR